MKSNQKWKAGVGQNTGTVTYTYYLIRCDMASETAQKYASRLWEQRDHRIRQQGQQA